MENLMSVLRELEPKWQEVGKAFGLSDDLLDEIFTNGNSPYDCMADMLTWYLRRCETTPTWDNVAMALERMGETRLAENVRQTYETGELMQKK